MTWSLLLYWYTLPFQLWSSDVSELEYDDSESESNSASAGGHLSSPASQSQSSLKSSSDGHLKGLEELLPHIPLRPHPLTSSQSIDESIVDLEGKWTDVFVKNSLLVSVYINCSYLFYKHMFKICLWINFAVFLLLVLSHDR